jgi:hypothetical protein
VPIPICPKVVRTRTRAANSRAPFGIREHIDIAVLRVNEDKISEVFQRRNDYSAR